MTKWKLYPLICLLAACDVPSATLVTGSDGQTLIQINSGDLTCYNNGCLRIDASTRSMQLIGNRRTRVPRGIDVSDGLVTPEEFLRMRQAAMLAGGLTSPDNR
ncbi:MAG: hypothetical protein AB3N21_08430 [Ruegeria sp.]|uniref:hypothetical protein n=1 Tax=Ruegeria sp. TaxID=1879320 RepID=UPI00349EF169